MHKTIEPYLMSPQRRELFLRVVDGHPDFHPITTRLHFLADHFPPDKLDRALAWLILNRNTGRRFIEWYVVECQNSDLEMHRLLLSIIANKDKERVLAGKNFIT